MDTTVASSLGFRRKISYSVTGVVIGYAAMLALFSIISKPWNLPASNFGREFYFSLSCALLGWVVIGIPSVVLINTAFIASLKWYVEVMLGALLGAVAMLVLFMMVGQLLPRQSLGDAYFLLLAMLVSVVAFSVYCALTRQALHKQEEEEKAAAEIDQPLQILRPLTRIDINSPELPLDIYKSEYLNTLEPSDPRRSTSELSRPPDSRFS